MDDVDRDYYVYIHLDNETGVPFYVGRGKGKRAFSKKGRSAAWHERVDSLSKSYSVEIVKDNLTEDESCECEMELIEKYGRLSDKTGTLVNVLEGGNDILKTTLRVRLPDSLVAKIEENYKSKQYKELKPNQEKDFIEKLRKEMESFQEAFLALQDDTQSDEDDEMYDLDCIIGSAIENTISLTNKCLRKKISYKDFAYGIEEGFEDMETDLEDFEPTERTEPLISLGNKILKYLRKRVDDLKPS